MPPDTNLFTGVYSGLPRLLIPIYKQHRERGNVGVVRETGRTADDRVIKAEPRGQASGDRPSMDSYILAPSASI